MFEKANKKDDPLIHIDKSLEKEILDFINDKYEKDFNNLTFIMNLGSKIKGNTNLGYFWETYKQIRINRKGKDKYIFYQNDIFKIKKDNSIEIVNGKEKDKFLKETFESDIYFLQKKRLRK